MAIPSSIPTINIFFHDLCITPRYKIYIDNSDTKGRGFGFQEDLEYEITSGEIAYSKAAIRPAFSPKNFFPTKYTKKTVAIPINATITAGPTGSILKSQRKGVIK